MLRICCVKQVASLKPNSLFWRSIDRSIDWLKGKIYREESWREKGLTSNSSLPEWFPQRICPQTWFFCVMVNSMDQPNMTHPLFWKSLAVLLPPISVHKSLSLVHQHTMPASQPGGLHLLHLLLTTTPPPAYPELKHVQESPDPFCRLWPPAWVPRPLESQATCVGDGRSKKPRPHSYDTFGEGLLAFSLYKLITVSLLDVGWNIILLMSSDLREIEVEKTLCMLRVVQRK